MLVGRPGAAPRGGRRPLGLRPGRSELAGLVAGGIGGVLLATNMLEVWQAKYPTTEISAQLFFLGALLGLDRGGRRPARGRRRASAGLLTVVGFLDRGDGLIPVLLAAAFGAALIATRRWDARATWFAVGRGGRRPARAVAGVLVLGRAALQPGQLGARACGRSSVVVVGLFVLGALLRPVGPAGRRLARATGGCSAASARVRARRWRPGSCCSGSCAPGCSARTSPDFGGQRSRSYDEQILARLSWFLSEPGLRAAAARRRRDGPAALVRRPVGAAVPLLLIFPVYGVHARNSTRLMWWSRRYVPSVVPLVLMLVAVGADRDRLPRRGLLARATRRPAAVRSAAARSGAPLVALAGTLALVVFFAGQSLPLRHHSEFGGSFDLSKRDRRRGRRPAGRVPLAAVAGLLPVRAVAVRRGAVARAEPDLGDPADRPDAGRRATWRASGGRSRASPSS